jgi:hypothetical protein
MTQHPNSLADSRVIGGIRSGGGRAWAVVAVLTGLTVVALVDRQLGSALEPRALCDLLGRYCSRRVVLFRPDLLGHQPACADRATIRS